MPKKHHSEKRCGRLLSDLSADTDSRVSIGSVPAGMGSLVRTLHLPGGDAEPHK
ncbi:MAG: hypothetical protein RLZZ538_1204 [Actinomycetota bacterium]